LNLPVLQGFGFIKLVKTSCSENGLLHKNHIYETGTGIAYTHFID